MKLIYFTSGQIPSRWAHSIQVVKMAQAFEQVGCDVELVVYCSPVDMFRRHKLLDEIWEQYGVSTKFKITFLPVTRLADMEKRRDCGRLSLSCSLAAYAKYRRADVVYARDYLTPYWTASMGIPTIAETHVDPDDNYQKQKLYQATKLPSFKAMVSISSILADKFVDAGVPEKKIIVEQDGVDLSTPFSVGARDVARIRNGLLQQRKSLVLYAGHLYDYKGIPLILRAAEMRPDITFVLVGGWEQDIKRVENIVKERYLKNVTLIGFVANNDVSTYLHAADILLLPYSAGHHQAQTTSPLKLFEYMAAGKPIVAAALDNIITVLKHGRNAFLFRPDDVDDFLNAIDGVLVDAVAAKEVGIQAASDAQYYDYRQRCNRILRFAGF